MSKKVKIKSQIKSLKNFQKENNINKSKIKNI